MLGRAPWRRHSGRWRRRWLRSARASQPSCERSWSAAPGRSPPDMRITLHGSADLWATGSFATVRPALGDGVDAVVASCWDVASGATRIGALHQLMSADVDVGAYLRLDRDWSEGGTTGTRLREYIETGMDELHL